MPAIEQALGADVYVDDEGFSLHMHVAWEGRNHGCNFPDEIS